MKIKLMKNKKIKMIELSPEWVLMQLNNAYFIKDDGICRIETICRNDDLLLSVAFNYLSIPYKGYFIDEDLGINGYEFKIKDIKYKCPTFYLELKILDFNHNNRFIEDN